METLSSFFEMGGYGGYIWPAYGLTAFALVAVWIVSRNALKSDEATLKLLQEQNPRRRRKNSDASPASAEDLPNET